MAEKGIIFDPDHMSVRARYAAMDFYSDTAGEDPLAAELYQNPKFHGLPYSGVASSHSWADDGIYQKIALSNTIEPMEEAATVTVPVAERALPATVVVALMMSLPLQPVAE